MGPTAAQRYLGDGYEDQGESPRVQRTRRESMAEHGSFAQAYTVIPEESEDHPTAAAIHFQHATEIMGPYIQQSENPAATSNEPDSAEAKVAEELPSELTGVLSLADKLDLLKEITALWTNNMATPDEQGGGFRGHMAYLEQSPAAQDTSGGLLQGWGQLYGYIQKLDAEVQEQAAAERDRIIQQAQTPQMDPVQMAKMRTEELKQQIAMGKAESEIAIASAKANLDARIKIADHNVSARIKESNLRIGNQQRQNAAV